MNKKSRRKVRKQLLAKPRLLENIKLQRRVAVIKLLLFVFLLLAAGLLTVTVINNL